MKYIFPHRPYSKNPVETVGINKIERGPANSNGSEVRQLNDSFSHEQCRTSEDVSGAKHKQTDKQVAQYLRLDSWLFWTIVH